MRKYILVNHQPVEEPDVLKWAEWFGKTDRTVAHSRTGQVRVSTVFLGIDHTFHEKDADHDPVLWETIILGGPHHGWTDRYTSVEAARAGHEMGVAIADGLVTPEAVCRNGSITGSIMKERAGAR